MKYLLHFVIVLVAFASCKKQPTTINDLEAGDIIFQDLDCGDFCVAINKVTEGWNGRDFSHCAIVAEENDSLFIIEAVSAGVKKTSFKEFFGKHTGNGGTVLGRVKPEYKSIAQQAAKHAFKYLGKSYDEVFDINNDKYYCSELIYETFKEANEGKEVFHLFPMTYKDPDTKEYFPIWVDYFNNLGEHIPEDEPGLNPGGISRSSYLEVTPLKL
ncbi:YiiX/YebB-like N1pC/P60 family cysteine hydrolase [Flammeovirga agarivorans]|uniref:Permuted papain-like amidase enzyme, YaeF/YiiX, C92 family n=1 Tax=Flammeovirga agarivorans TaxID=2726742 RepID=A0A7X8SNT4_9BACT|nr:YiiX/YebB-like N1pC/P60 family cysteine hydrolase [Flammeovirga agarivorans]NLR93651.1 hypothetical protein [Flammeovirga agarivorans]